jgi:hypothetical protein
MSVIQRSESISMIEYVNQLEGMECDNCGFGSGNQKSLYLVNKIV